MRRACYGLAICVGCGVLPLSAQQDSRHGDDKPGQATKHIGEWIQQLGSTRFAERERAAKELETLGESALPALRAVAREAATAKTVNLEVRRRAAEIQRRIEEKIATAQILAPRRVQLNLKDVSILAAIKELEKQSGYPITVHGDSKQLAGKKITLVTGETTFWEAFDQLCREAGLIDGDPYLPAIVPPAVPPIRVAPPIRNRPRPAAPILPVIPGKAEKKGPILNVGFAVEVQPVAQAQQQPAQPVEGKVLRDRDPGHYLQQRPPSNHLQVRPGKPMAAPTSYAGAVRIRALARKESGSKDEFAILLDVFAEPRLQDFTLNGTPRVDRANDDQGQPLSLELPGGPGTHMVYAPGNRQAILRFKLGDKKVNTVAELTGSLTAQAQMPTETLVTIANVLKAQGKIVKGVGGASMQIISAQKNKDSTFTIKVRLEDLPRQNANGALNGVVIQQLQVRGGNIVINGVRLPQSIPTLVDKDGRTFHLVDTPSRGLRIENGAMSQELTMNFKANPGQSEPDRLLLTGQRTVTFQVPFTFRNINIRHAEVGQPVP